MVLKLAVITGLYGSLASAMVMSSDFRLGLKVLYMENFPIQGSCVIFLLLEFSAIVFVN